MGSIVLSCYFETFLGRMVDGHCKFNENFGVSWRIWVCQFILIAPLKTWPRVLDSRDQSKSHSYLWHALTSHINFKLGVVIEVGLWQQVNTSVSLKILYCASKNFLCLTFYRSKCRVFFFGIFEGNCQTDRKFRAILIYTALANKILGN